MHGAEERREFSDAIRIRERQPDRFVACARETLRQ
jgi:hypothetical protein